MDKKFLRTQMIKLETNYGRDKFQITPEMFDLWYEMFSNCAEEGLKLAVDKCIMENEYAPNIAGLMKYYKELEEERNDLRDTIQHQYTTIRSIWGEKYDGDTFKTIAEYIMRQPKKLRKIEMVELTHRMVSFSHDCDIAGRLDKPTIKAYIQGAR